MLQYNKAEPSSRRPDGGSRWTVSRMILLFFSYILVGALIAARQIVPLARQGDVSKIEKKNDDAHPKSIALSQKLEGVLAVNESSSGAARKDDVPANKTLSQKEDKGGGMAANQSLYTPKRPSPLSMEHVVDFAVVGFPKCGTTTLNHIFKKNVAMLKGDTCIYGRKGLVKQFQEGGHVYNNSVDPNTMLRGFKCPRFLEHYRGTLPDQLPFIVTVRHPVRWFESFYNMIGRQPKGPKIFLGACKQGVLCTDRGKFYLPLSKLNQTNLSQGERDLIGVGVGDSLGAKRLPNPVFLIESTQLGDTNTSRRMQLSDDLAEFVGLEQHSLRDAVPHVSPAGKKQDDKWKIQICDVEHAPIRAELMKHARVGGRWLRDYFLREGKGVYTSSPEFLMELLEKWEIDPCDEEKSE